ncbi:MAG: DUF3300 domain-containing protein [Candidatus Acidiferrales bacterium]
MNTYARERTLGQATSGWTRRLLLSALALAVSFAACPRTTSAFQDAQDQPQQDPQDAQQPDQNGAPATPATPAYTTQTPEQLQQLVAPIALYPDSLVAQVLAASTFPAQIVEADRWVQDHSDLKGDALAQAVDQQSWDPSVKALTAFPSVLANMDKNLSWTSSLGDAYYNQQQDVMDAVQVMRQKAQQTGNLKSTPQQNVEQQGSTIVIQPADPQIVYVPAYNPWLVYGYPVTPWPYWYQYPGIWYGGPYLSFGVGFGVGFYGGYGWGWHNWGTNWHNHVVVYNHNTYYSRSNTFYNRNNYYRNGGYRGVGSSVNRNLAQEHGEGYNNRNGGLGAAHGAADSRGRNVNNGGVYNRGGATPKPFNGDNRAARGFDQPRADSGTRSSAFSGYNHGGESRSYSSRGAQSFGGGGGGNRGGGGGGGGRHR